MSNSSSHSLPSWVWLFTGVVTGLFLAFLYYLAGVNTSDDVQNSTKTTKNTRSTPSASPAYDFYKLLPNAEVKTRNKAPAIKNTPAATTTEAVFLQAGSFQSAGDADRRRAEVLMLGLNASTQTANIKGSTWYRVHIGPFENQQHLAQAKSLLTQSHIEYIQRTK